MAICPFAIWKPLPQNATQRNDNDDIQVIFHSLTSTSALSSWDYFAGTNAQGTEPHFLMEYDGTLIQCMDTTDRADANWDANTHAISVETASNHGATDPWTPEQLATLTKLGQWLLAVHPTIGHRVCRTATDPGFGYHRLFYEWNQSNHSCPGDARVGQFPALVGAILAPEDVVTQQDKDDIIHGTVALLLWSVVGNDNVTPGTVNVKTALGRAGTEGPRDTRLLKVICANLGIDQAIIDAAAK